MRRDPGDKAEATMDDEVADEREVHAVLEDMYRAEQERMTSPDTAKALRRQVEALGYAPDQARVMVALFEHRADTWARRTGGKAEEWFARRGIKFKRGRESRGGYGQEALDDMAPDERTGAVRGWVDELLAASPKAMPTKVVENFQALPEDVRAEAEARGKEGTGAMVMDQGRGTMWVVADRVRGRADMDRLWRHDQGWHHGLRGLFEVYAPEAFTRSDGVWRMNRFLGDVAERAGGKELGEVAERYRLDLSDPKQRLVAAEEYLAGIAEKVDAGGNLTKAESTAWERFKAFLREMLGLAPETALADKDVMDVIRKARAWVDEGRTYGQAANLDVDPDMEIPIVDLTGVMPVKISGPDGRAWVTRWEGAPLEIETRTRGRWLARLRGVRAKDKQHPFWSSRGPRERSNVARRKALAALEKILDGTVLIESFANRKPKEKPDVDTVHWLYVPVDTGSGVSLLRITAFESKGAPPVVKGVEVYDVLPKGKLPLAATSKRGRGAGPRGSTIKIRTMLAGVKDVDGNPYSFPQSDRGEVSFTDNGATVLVFENANLSTILHETGHIFLEDLAESAAEGFEVETFDGARKWFAKNAGTVVRELEARRKNLKQKYLREKDPEKKQALGLELTDADEVLSTVTKRGGAEYVAGLAGDLTGFTGQDAADQAVLTRFHEMFARGNKFEGPDLSARARLEQEAAGFSAATRQIAGYERPARRCRGCRDRLVGWTGSRAWWR